MKHFSEGILSQFDHSSKSGFNSSFDSLISIRHELLNIQKISDLMSIERDCFVAKSQEFCVVETLEDIINIKNYYNSQKAVEVVFFYEGTNGEVKVQGDSERI